MNDSNAMVVFCPINNIDVRSYLGVFWIISLLYQMGTSVFYHQHIIMITIVV